MEVKNLKLFDDLLFSTTESSATTPMERLCIYTNAVAKNNLEPQLEQYLTDRQWAGYGYYGDDPAAPTHRIPAGNYFFLQEFVPCDIADEDQLTAQAFKMAEALRLESLWQEIDLEDQVFVRFIREDDKTAVQVIRRKLSDDQ